VKIGKFVRTGEFRTEEEIMTGRLVTLATGSEPDVMKIGEVSASVARTSVGPKTPATPPLRQPSDHLGIESSEASPDVFIVWPPPRQSLDQRIESFRQKAVAQVFNFHPVDRAGVAEHPNSSIKRAEWTLEHASEVNSARLISFIIIQLLALFY